ncbi:MAG: nuclear transport factor 2 family protein [Verrucomicrobiota bacterium]|nr:nuclear transport factor 2 family protein [Verrucomicrobiota bacterium]
MKTPLLILAALALPAIAFAQTKTNAETEKTVTKIEHDFSAALVKGETAVLEPMMADDLQIVTPDGATETKAQFLADVKSGDLKFEASDISDIKVHGADADMAVVTYRSSDKGKYKGNDVSGEYRWTDVLMKRDGKWQFIVAQGTPIAKRPGQ